MPNSVNGSYLTTHVWETTSLGQVLCEQQASPDRHQATVCNKEMIKIATWNVRTLHQPGKLAGVWREMNRMKIDILGVSEVRWPGVGENQSEEGCFVYSGGEGAVRGVGVMMSTRVAKCVMGYWAVSDRVLVVKIKGKPFDINIVQVYAPTSERDEDEVDEFYDKVDEVLDQCKNHEITIVMGDVNAKVGEGRLGEAVGPFGLGERNERGERWANWCTERQQMVMNTWFRQHPRRLWTWMSPGDRARNQIDYMTINKRYRNAVTKVRTYPGADCDSDHVPVVADIRVRLKKLKREEIKPRRDVQVLKRNEELKQRYILTVENKYQMLRDECDENDPGQQWKRLSDAIEEGNQKVLPEKRRRRKNNWITEEIFELMDERRAAKGRDNNIYRELNRQIKRKCREAKEKWLDEQCKEIEDLEKRDTRMMYNKIREITQKKGSINGRAIKDKDGKVLMETEAIKERWEEYIKELFEDERQEEEVEEENPRQLDGEQIIEAEVKYAMSKMKRGKAAGEDGIMVEMLEALGEFAIKNITVLLNQIYNEGTITEQMCRSIFIPLPKINGTLECSKHRTISIMNQLTKMMLRVILNRIKNRVREQVSWEQCGFLEGKGTTNAIFTMRTIIERMIEKQRNVFFCFIDYEKAFDKVRHDELMTMLEELHIDGKEMRFIRNLYWNQEAAVRVQEEVTRYQKIRRGVRQGCVMSPDLFNLYGEMILRELQDLEGVNIGGYNINHIRYADDTVLVADSVEKLQHLLNVTVRASEEKGLRVNMDKTKVMVASKTNSPRIRIEVGGRRIEQVEKFSYLGSWITEDGRCDKEIRMRIGIAKSAFKKMKTYLTNRKLSTRIRKRAAKTFVWSTLLYGCETWTVSRRMQEKLEAAEMWLWRRILKIPWTARRTNAEVLRQMGTERELMMTIRKRQMRFLGHVMRRNEMESVVLTGMVEGRRARGRQREKFMDGMMRVTGGHLRPSQLLQLTRDRDRWRSMVAQVQVDAARR